MLREWSECTRCGTCCIMYGTCSAGKGKKDKESGACIYLIVHEDLTTSCEHVVKGRCEPSHIGVGPGCIPRAWDPEFLEKEACAKEIKLKIRGKCNVVHG